MAEYERVTQPFAPVYDGDSRILILGSLPSVKSREQGFYYGHARNRFWPMLAAVYREPVPQTIPDKKALLLRHGLAVYDVIESCEICGSSDSSIRNVVPSDLKGLLQNSGIHTVIANGAKAYELYEKHQLPVTGIKAQKLPSTSPANAAWSFGRLKEAWGAVLLGI